MKKSNNIYKITIMALLSAIAIILFYLEISIPIIPSFIKFDLSDIPALLATIIFNPLYGITVSFIKNIIHLFFTYTPSTFGIGEFSNFLLSIFLILPLGWFTKNNKNNINISLGCLIGSVIMGVLCIFTNYYIVYPIYTNLMPIEAIVSAYKAINPFVNNLWECLICFNLPFTICKGLIESLLTIILFKFLKKPLKKILKDSKM